MWDDCQFAENCCIYVNNRKYCSKSGFQQNQGFEENTDVDHTFVDHSDLNERVYPYVYDRNARFSRVDHNMRLPKTNLQFEIKLMGLLHTNDVQYARKAIFCTNNPHNFTIQMLPKAVQIYEICAFKQKHSSISTHIYSII